MGPRTTTPGISVTILDANLRAQLSRILGKNSLTDPIHDYELAELRSLESPGTGIRNIEGLQYATGLEDLNLLGNRLSGRIPIEHLLQFTELRILNLSRNYLSGTIPPEIGQLTNLEDLFLRDNRLTGSVPWNLRNLSNIDLAYALKGNLITGIDAPPERTRNSMYSSDPAANGNASHHSISYFQGPLLLERELDQAPVEHQTPILGRWAALAVRIDHDVPEPPLVITRVLDAQDVVLAESLAEATLPVTAPDQSGSERWRTEYVFDMPGELFQAGNQLVHVIDPDNELAETDEADNATEPFVISGTEPPPLHITFFPLHSSGEEPPDVDSDTLMVGPSAFLPIADSFEARIGYPILAVPGSLRTTLNRLLAIWNARAAPDEFYHGVYDSSLALSDDEFAGIAFLPPVRVAVSRLFLHRVIPHEIGHNLSLGHPPGCEAELLDNDYPYPDGQLGPDRGWDVNWRRFVSRDDEGFADVMSYCEDSHFISDYNYRKASEYWLSSGSESSTSGVRSVDTPELRMGDRRSPQTTCTDSQDCENGPATSTSQSAATTADPGSLALSGMIDADGNWSLTQSQSQFSENGPRPPVEDGEYTLILLDSAGVQVYEEPLAIISVSEGDDSFWAARTPIPLRPAREVVILDPQGAEVLREPL